MTQQHLVCPTCHEGYPATAATIPVLRDDDVFLGWMCSECYRRLKVVER